MKAGSKKWSSRIVNGKKGQYGIVTGLAFPSLVEGKNTTTKVTSNLKDRNSWYHDPAFQVSMSELDDIDGAEGAPLCVEHDRKHVVGHVHHSYIDESDPKRGWRIMARIPLKDEQGNDIEAGRKAFNDINEGELNGFSVGVQNQMTVDNNTGERHVCGRVFHEVSLVNQPFFDGCNLSATMVASKDGKGKFFGNNSTRLDINYENLNYNYYLEQELFVPFSDMSAPDNNNTEAPAPSDGDRNLKTLEEMVKQTDMLKQQLNEANAARSAAEKAQQEAAKAQLADKERDELAALRADKEAQLKKYHEEQLPKAEQYIKFLEEVEGAPVHDTDKQVYINAFTIPKEDYQRQAQRFMNHMESHQKQAVEMAASKKALEDKEAAYKKEKDEFAKKEKKMAELLSQAGPNMKASYEAAFLSSPNFQVPDKKDEAKEEPRKESVGMNASRIAPGEVANPPPGEHERGFLELYNYTSSIDMNASNNDPFAAPQRLFPASMPAISVHNQLTNREGDLNFPWSDRYHNPAKFSWLEHRSGLATADNLMDFVNMNASKELREVKREETRSLF